jgi:flagellar basal body-associated protein FliL
VIGKDKTLSGLIESKKSQVHDALITVLGNQTIEDIEGTGGRNKLRVALISALNTALGKGIAEELYFLDLIIQ